MQYLNAIVTRLFFIVLQVAAALGVISTIAASQLEREANAATLRQVVTGRVCMPDGSPAAGAVVVTSAGGQAFTGADGSFALTVDLPLDAESLEVTAVADELAGSGSLVASSSIVPAALSPTSSAGRLELTLSSSCHPRWLPTFGGLPGTDRDVVSLVVFDDGSGPALYAGGSFATAGGVGANFIARWDGSRWSALGSGMGGGSVVNALTVYDDGSGPALYAGGHFTTAGGVAANRVAKWDGSSWSALGSGMNSIVSALTVFDDGSGPALYAGGTFTSAGGVTANRIAKWDGSSWTTLGSGITNGGVLALTVYDDGSGPALYAGGSFTTAGSVGANRIAKWDGSSWSALGSGMSGAVFACSVFNDGNGPALYAGGGFTTAGGLAANSIAKWDGSSWTTLGSGMNSSVYVAALAVYDDGSGPALYAGGDFTRAGGVSANRIAKWDGSSWTTEARPGAVLGSGMNNSVSALTVYDDGSGQALYAGGTFTSVDSVATNRIAKWDGSSWSALGSGMTGGFAVSALTVFDDGSGPALYAGGIFTSAGGVPANSIAKWDVSSWSALSSGMTGVQFPYVGALTVFDDGSGPGLYAGGSFTSAGGVPANNMAKWDGSSWSALGMGTNSHIHCLTVYDDGGGPALYAGGEFTRAGGVPANNIAKWDGSRWSALGSGMAGGVPLVVYDLCVFDDGSGPALIAGGQFLYAGGVPANRIAKWDGSSWSALGGGFRNSVLALIVHDDGYGPALLAAGELGKRVAKWDGSRWLTIARGINSYVSALAIWDDGDGSALFAGGAFTASPAGDSYLAKRGCPEAKVKQRKL